MTEAGCTHTQCVLYISQSIDLKETHVHLMLKKKKLCSANAGMLYHIVLYCMELYYISWNCIVLHGIVFYIREDPFNEVPPLFGHCPFDGLGHFFREEFSKFNWAFA